ncbi:PHP domain-containing protein [Nanoarchaeota archaeon]
MNTYDLHVHTYHSICSNNRPQDIIRIAKKRKLNGLAITDHNEIKGALQTKKINQDRNFEVIIGEEVKTPQGEVLAYYLNTKIKPGPIEEVLDQIKKQGAIAVLAHPFAYRRDSFKADIKKIKNKIQAIECFNARSIFPRLDKKAHQLAQKNNLAKTGGSDAHFNFEIGRGYTQFNHTLKEAIKRKQTQVKGKYLYAPLGYLKTFIRKKL